MHQNAFGGRALPRPAGELTALPQTPVAGLKGRRGEREGRSGEGKGEDGEGEEGKGRTPNV